MDGFLGTSLGMALKCRLLDISVYKTNLIIL
jgi:hypothetical protein